MTGLLVLHAVRLKGFADTAAVAARYGLDIGRTHEDLLDAQAHGWVGRSSFADVAGWSLTGTGRRYNEEQLRAELDGAGARGTVTAVHDRFRPLNERASRVFTAWQLDSGGSLDAVGRLADEVRDLERPLTACVGRFAGYHDRFTTALARAGHDPALVTDLAPGVPHALRAGTFTAP